MHLALCEVVVDSIDGLLVKCAQQNLIQRLRRCEIVPEGLFNNNTCAFGAVGLDQLFHDSAEQHRRDRKIVCRTLRPPELLAQCLERCWLLVVAAHVPELARQFGKRHGIQSTMFF